MLPGSAVPLIVGVLSPVVLPVVGEITVGAAGAVLSMLNARAGDGTLPPPESVTVAMMLCGPLPNAPLGVQVQLPAAFAVVVQRVAPPSVTTTVPLGVPVPLMTGVVLLTVWPAVGLLMTDAMALLTVKFCVSAGPVLPAASVAVVLSVCGPLVNGVLVQLQLPLALAWVVQIVVAPSFTTTVLFGSAVPARLGV